MMLAALLIVAFAPQDRVWSGPVLEEDAALLRARAEPCRRDADAITVCNSAPIDGTRWAARPIRATAALPNGGSIAAHGEQRGVAGGSAPAAMVTVTVPLGPKARPKK